MKLESPSELSVPDISQQKAKFLAECVHVASNNPEFVENWARLRGFKLPASPLDRMIDATTGHGDAIAMQFIADVDDLFCQRLTLPASKGSQPEAREHE